MSRLHTIFIPFISGLQVVSFNRLSILAAITAATTPSPHGDLVSPTQIDRSILSAVNSSGFELGNLQPLSNPITSHNDGKPNWKKIGKIVHTVGLGSFGTLITLLINSPISAAIHHAIYTAYLTVICLSITTSLGLSFFSVLMEESPVVGWVKIRLIYFSFSFVGLACFIRLCLALQLAYIGFGMASALIGIIVIALYLLFGSRTNETGVEREDVHSLC